MLLGSFRYRRKASSEAGYLYLVLLLLVVIISYLLMRLWNRASESTA